MKNAFKTPPNEVWFEARALIEWNGKEEVYSFPCGNDFRKATELCRKLRGFALQYHKGVKSKKAPGRNRPGRKFLWEHYKMDAHVIDIMGVFRVLRQQSRMSTEVKAYWPIDQARVEQAMKPQKLIWG